MKILKGEHLFNKEGLHVLNAKDIAIRAEEDTECEILPEHLERVQQIVIAERLAKGLDADGSTILEKQEELIIEDTPIES